MRSSKRVLAHVVVLSFFISLWWLVSRSPYVAFSLSTPSSFSRAVIEHTASSALPYHALITALEAGAGFIVGVLLGTSLSFVLWCSPLAMRYAQPYLFTASILPVFALAPLVILWFGIGLGMKVALCSFASALVALAQANEGARQIPKSQLDTFSLLEATRAQVVRKLIIPSSLSWVFQGMRLNVGVALQGALLGEFISANSGLGYFMIRAGGLYKVEDVLAGVAYLVLVALFFQAGVWLVEKRSMVLIRWIAS